MASSKQQKKLLPVKSGPTEIFNNTAKLFYSFVS